MKHFTCILVIILFFSSISVVKAIAAPNKIALVVAVAKYPKEGGWSQISSDKDVPLITNALKTQGFTDVTLIMDQQATKEGIIAAIKNLTGKVSEGDIVVFHFSGHGQQIQDDNGDEKDDGYDEAIVPYDARVRYEPGVYEGKNHLRDDELDVLFNALREKLGKNGNLLVILDACHSGTATRGLAKARGTFEKMAPETFKPSTSGKTEVGMADVNNPNKPTSRGATKELASMVVISGASPSQLNYETRDEEGNSVGSLSYAFSRAVRKASSNTSYRGFFEEIKVDMSTLAPNQKPQVEGNLDVTIFGGEAIEQAPYLAIEKWKDENTLVIDGGTVMGLFPKSIVAFYPKGTSDPTTAKLIATGEVISADAFSCIIKPEKPISKVEAQTYWVFIKEQNYGDLHVNVMLDVNNPDLSKLLYGRLAEEKMIKIVESNPDLLIEYRNKYTRGSNVQITASNDMVLYNQAYNQATTQELIQEIVALVKAYAQGNLLRNLDLEAASFDVSFEFIPILANADETEKSRYPIDEKMDANNMIVFKEGDYFKLRITNKGDRIAYYSLIDIQPDNQVNILIPVYDAVRQRRIPATDFKINPGTTVELDYTFFFGPPFGTEIFKLVASETPLNLEPIIMSKGAGTRGDMNPLELLLADSYGTRGGGVGHTPNIPQGTANTYTVIFTISAK